ncbi:MAG: DUF255 domain-containing protein [Caldithrix sp.]|nr:DUF255 domain-containing protein [Caldithrix sp.]
MIHQYGAVKVILCLLITGFGMMGCEHQTKSVDTSFTGVHEFDPERDPAVDLQKAIKAAQQTNKRIVLDVGGEWCVWCHKLDSLIAQNDSINTLLRDQFITVKINYSKKNKNDEFLSGYPPITGYPHLFILDSDGTLLHSQNTAMLEKGKRHDPQKVFAFFNAWQK